MDNYKAKAAADKKEAAERKSREFVKKNQRAKDLESQAGTKKANATGIATTGATNDLVTAEYHRQKATTMQKEAEQLTNEAQQLEVEKDALDKEADQLNREAEN